MAIVYRSAGSTLTHAQLDNNFTELNSKTSSSSGGYFTTQNLYADRLYTSTVFNTVYQATTIYIGSGYNSLNRKITLNANATISFSGSTSSSGTIFSGVIGHLAIKSNGYTYTFTDLSGVLPVGMTEGFDAIKGNSLYSSGTDTWHFYTYWRCGYSAQGTPETPAIRIAYTGSAG